MNTVATTVVVLFALGLIAFAGIAFAKPAIAGRFLMGFASSAQSHYLEQIVRVIVGAALVVAAPMLWQPHLFRIFGWLVLISSAALICLPWRWHQRLGQRGLPLVVRYLKPYAVGALALGGVLLYATIVGPGASLLK